MPNHVYSTLEILGDKKTLEEIKSFLQNPKEKKHHFDFNQVIPTPDHIFLGDFGPAEKEKYGKNNWYDWNIENWGTKWNSYSNTVDLINATSNSESFILDTDILYVLSYTFQTAWSPISTTILTKLSEKFPNQPMLYVCVDEGGGFAGKEIFKRGEIVFSKDYKNMKSLDKYTTELSAQERVDKSKKDLLKYLKK